MRIVMGRGTPERNLGEGLSKVPSAIETIATGGASASKVADDVRGCLMVGRRRRQEAIMTSS